jgi:hypothetical protein
MVDRVGADLVSPLRQLAHQIHVDRIPIAHNVK